MTTKKKTKTKTIKTKAALVADAKTMKRLAASRKRFQQKAKGDLAETVMNKLRRQKDVTSVVVIATSKAHDVEIGTTNKTFYGSGKSFRAALMAGVKSWATQSAG